MTGRITATAAALAITADISLRAGITNLAGFLAICAGGILLALAGGTRTRQAKLMTLAAVAVGMWLPIRASTWLLNLNALTAVALITAAALFGDAPALRLTMAQGKQIIGRLFMARFAPSLARQSLTPADAGMWRALMPVARGLALALIPVAVLGALLARADAVFAAAVSPGWAGWTGGSLAAHAIVVPILGLAALGLVCIARSSAPAAAAQTRPFGVVESLVVVASVAVLFAIFATAQLVSALGGADRILAGQDLTYAEYARQGFFQLLWVAALTLLLLTSLNAVTATSAPRYAGAQRLAGALVAVLTVLIVAVAIVRLRLYTDEFGQTTLRWYCTAFAWMLGVIFVLLAARQVLPARRPWFGWTTMAVVVVTLLLVNVVNPEARVATHNLARDGGVELDADYLTRLSADAWPTLLRHEADIVASLADGRVSAQTLFEERCRLADRDLHYGPLGFNLSHTRLAC